MPPTLSSSATNYDVTLGAPATPPAIEATDGELLNQFTRHGDADALAEVVDRHAEMVWSVCTRLLTREADAEDAFQATMLILARRASTVRANDSAGGWLFRVAYRTALLVKRRRKSRRERSLDESLENGAPPAPEREFPDIERRQTIGVLIEELRGLPDKYQTPLVLRYLESKSRRQIADATDTTVATIAGRLVRGKRMLRLRLARRGVSLAVAMAAVSGTAHASQSAGASAAPIPSPPLFDPGLIASGASTAVSTLVTQGVRSMMVASFAKPAMVGSAAVVALAVALVDPAAHATPAADADGSRDGIVLNIVAPAETAQEAPAVAIAAAHQEPTKPPALADAVPLNDGSGRFLVTDGEGEVRIHPNNENTFGFGKLVTGDNQVITVSDTLIAPTVVTKDGDAAAVGNTLTALDNTARGITGRVVQAAETKADLKRLQTLVDEGRHAEAIAGYQQAIQQQAAPRWILRNNLAHVLATSNDPAVRDPMTAVAQAQLAIAEMPSGNAARLELIDTLAVAQAATGDLETARRSIQSEIDRATRQLERLQRTMNRFQPTKPAADQDASRGDTIFAPTIITKDGQPATVAVESADEKTELKVTPTIDGDTVTIAAEVKQTPLGSAEEASVNRARQEWAKKAREQAGVDLSQPSFAELFAMRSHWSAKQAAAEQEQRRLDRLVKSLPGSRDDIEAQVITTQAQLLQTKAKILEIERQMKQAALRETSGEQPPATQGLPGPPHQPLASRAKIEALQELVNDNLALWKKIKKLRDQGARGGSADQEALARAAFYDAKAQLDRVRGRTNDASDSKARLETLENRVHAAEQQVEEVQKTYDAGRASLDLLHDALQRRAEAKIALSEAKDQANNQYRRLPYQAYKNAAQPPVPSAPIARPTPAIQPTPAQAPRESFDTRPPAAPADARPKVAPTETNLIWRQKELLMEQIAALKTQLAEARKIASVGRYGSPGKTLGERQLEANLRRLELEQKRNDALLSDQRSATEARNQQLLQEINALQSQLAQLKQARVQPGPASDQQPAQAAVATSLEDQIHAIEILAENRVRYLGKGMTLDEFRALLKGRPALPRQIIIFGDPLPSPEKYMKVREACNEIGVENVLSNGVPLDGWQEVVPPWGTQPSAAPVTLEPVATPPAAAPTPAAPRAARPRRSVWPSQSSSLPAAPSSERVIITVDGEAIFRGERMPLVDFTRRVSLKQLRDPPRQFEILPNPGIDNAVAMAAVKRIGEAAHMAGLAARTVTGIPDARQFDPTLGTQENPLMILGKITSGGRAQSLGPPTGEKVLEAYNNALAQGNQPALNPESLQGVHFEEVSHYADPSRVYPLIGPAQQLHSVYKATIKHPAGHRTVYVDHHHLHINEPTTDSKPALTNANGPTPRSPRQQLAETFINRLDKPAKPLPQSRESIDGHMLRMTIEGMIKDPFGPKLDREDAEWLVPRLLMTGGVTLPTEVAKKIDPLPPELHERLASFGWPEENNIDDAEAHSREDRFFEAWKQTADSKLSREARLTRALDAAFKLQAEPKFSYRGELLLPKEWRFSEVKRRTLSVAGSRFMLDLDTGETMDPPQQTHRPDQVRMDAYPEQPDPKQRPKWLRLPRVMGAVMPPDAWDDNPPHIVLMTLGMQDTNTGKSMYGSLDKMPIIDDRWDGPPTCLFKTADGAHGILQVLGVNKNIIDKTYGVVVQYKLVERVGAPIASDAATLSIEGGNLQLQTPGGGTLRARKITLNADGEAKLEGLSSFTASAHPKQYVILTPDESPTLQYGDNNSIVQRLQRFMLRKHWPPPGAKLTPSFDDGNFGPLTRKAVERLQAANDLAQTGIVDAATWAALPPDPFGSAPILKPGDRGPLVREAVRLLKKHPAGESAAIDSKGRYAKSLEKAVRQFQEANGLRVTGEIETGTWRLLVHAKHDPPPKLTADNRLRAAFWQSGLEPCPEDNNAKSADIRSLWGLVLEPVPRDEIKQSRYRGGMRVKILAVDSPAAKVGVRVGDVLVGVEKWQMASHKDVAYVTNYLVGRPGYEKVKFYVLRDGQTLYGHLPLKKAVATTNKYREAIARLNAQNADLHKRLTEADMNRRLSQEDLEKRSALILESKKQSLQQQERIAQLEQLVLGLQQQVSEQLGKSAQLTAMQTQLAFVESQLAEHRKTLGEDHPKMRSLQAQRDELQRQIKLAEAVMKELKKQAQRNTGDKIQAGELLAIEVVNRLEPNSPILFEPKKLTVRVDAGGDIALGARWGRMAVANKTLREVETELKERITATTEAIYEARGAGPNTPQDLAVQVTRGGLRSRR